VLNSFLFPLWTALCVFSAAIVGALLRDRKLFYRWQRHWAKGAFRICGVELEVVGQDNMQPGRGYVVVANHQSHMDTPAIFAALPTTPGFLAKRELWRVPVLGTALRLGGHIRVDRGNRASALGSLDAAVSQVREGATVLFFPEGTRSESNALAKFKTGAFHLAKAAATPILPVGIAGTRSVLRKHGRVILPGKVRVTIGRSISVEEIEASELKALSQRARAAVADLSGSQLAGEG
jgi:1-acyl-sn-glycerol-3-phosphate acyltransferase